MSEKKIYVCMCGSPRLFKDITQNLNTGEQHEHAGVTCSECDYDGSHWAQVTVSEAFDCANDWVPTEIAEALENKCSL